MITLPKTEYRQTSGWLLGVVYLSVAAEIATSPTYTYYLRGTAPCQRGTLFAKSQREPCFIYLAHYKHTPH